jgi:hypothetical protein
MSSCVQTLAQPEVLAGVSLQHFHAEAASFFSGAQFASNFSIHHQPN